MRPDLEQKLYAKYPKIFVKHFKTTQESSMASGITCDDGWFDLIDNLCEQLQFNTDTNQHPQIVATQVKEKMAKLCFHVESSTSEHQATIQMAVAMSEKICEQCGNRATLKVSKTGSIKPRCTACVEEGDEIITTANIGKLPNSPTPPMWKLEQQQRTRHVLFEMPLTHDDHIHLKHEEIGYAKISILDLMASKFILHDKQRVQSYTFTDIEGVIAAGWLVD